MDGFRLVEGRGTSRVASGKEFVTHDGLALLYYDEKRGRYHWNGHELAAGAVDTEPRLVDGGFEWSFKAGEGGTTVRFTIAFDKTRWHEVGEVSPDGRSWNRFMEITLRRVR